MGTGLPGGNWQLNNTIAAAITPYNQVLVDDLDGDSLYELLITKNNSLTAYDATGNLKANVIVPNLMGHQPSISYYSSACGGAMHDIVLLENEGNANSYLDVYCFNGTALYSQGTHIQVTSYDFFGNTDSRGFARCNTDVGYDCRYVYSGANGLNVLGCNFFNNASLSSCSTIYSPGGINSGTAAISKFYPVSNTQYDGVYHVNALANVPSSVFIDDTGDSVASSWNILRGREISLWARSGASMYAAVPQGNELWILNTATGAKALMFTLDWNGSNAWGTINPRVSNSVVNEQNHICAAFKDSQVGETFYELRCKDATGTVTKNIFHLLNTSKYGTQANDVRLTATDVNGDSIDDYLFDGIVLDGAFGNIIAGIPDTFSIQPDGWMQPVDLLGRGVTDIIASDSLGNVRIYLANTTNPAACTDTDNATFPTKNYILQGTASLFGSYTDYCVNDNTLAEYYCASGTSLLLESNHNCAAGCFGGACLSCLESWSCSPYGSCTGGTQSRTCFDSNLCGTTYFKPVESQACGNQTSSYLAIPTTLVSTSDPMSFTSGAFLPEIFIGLTRFFSPIIIPALIIFLCLILAGLAFMAAGAVSKFGGRVR